jgi:hypothetical protein
VAVGGARDERVELDAGLGEPLAHVDDLAGARVAVDDDELDRLDVADDADPRRHGAFGRTSAAPLWRSQRRGSRYAGTWRSTSAQNRGE